MKSGSAEYVREELVGFQFLYAGCSIPEILCSVGLNPKLFLTNLPIVLDLLFPSIL